MLILVAVAFGATKVDAYIYNPTGSSTSTNTGGAIGGTITGGTTGSILFVDGGSALAQNNNNFYFQNSATSPQQLGTNTNVALSVNTNGDFTGTDAINAYGQYDAYLPNSAITNSLVGLNTDGAVPAYTVSSSRGTGITPVELNTGDLTGGYFGFGSQGTPSPTYQNLGGMAVYTTGASTNNLGGELDFYTKGDGGSLVQNMVLTNAGFLGVGTTGANTTSLGTFDVENLGATLATAAQGISLQNLTAAAAGTTQNSPALSFSSNGWGTTASSSQNVTFRMTSTPVQATIPTGNFIIGSSIAGGAYAARFTLSSAGGVTASSWSGTGGIVSTGANAVLTLTRTAIAGVSTDGLVSANTTASTAGATVQWAPRLRFSGTAWNTGGTPATNTDDYIVENQTISGNPTTSKLVFSSQLNAAGYNPVFTITSAGSVSIPTGQLYEINGTQISSSNLSDVASLATLAGSQTLTNKRINPRVNTISSSSTPTPAGDTTDEFTVTALAAGATFAAPTGTPVDGQMLTIRIKDNASPQTLAWNSIYRASSDLALPSTTIASKTMYLKFIYNATDTKWDFVAFLNNF